MQIIFTLADAKSAVEDRERFEDLAKFVYATRKNLGLEIERAVNRIAARSVVAGRNAALVRGELDDAILDWDEESFDVREFMDVFLPSCLDVEFHPDSFHVCALGRLDGEVKDELDALDIARIPKDSVMYDSRPALEILCALCAQAGAALLESVQA
jgi:hypothetical protein